MTKALILAPGLCALVTGFGGSSFGQRLPVPSPVSVSAERSNREQDGLDGPVRRVRVEVSKIIVKEGKLIEGPRVLRGIATYNPIGKKIDAVDYPVQTDSLPGREKYRYDDKGNIVEMVVLGGDSSILSKESYEYEFDQLGNWTKMNSSVAVYENGKMSFEPTEVTYRTISYYYNQEIEKLTASTSKPKGQAPRSAQSPIATSTSERKALANPIDTKQPVAEPAAADAKDTAKAALQVTSTQTEGNVTAGDAPAGTSTETNKAPANSSTPSVVKVAEDVMRDAAIDLPPPEYPAGALLSRTAGRVEVQLLVDEKGLVTNARATSGNLLLGSAAEAAARKARFSPTKLSADAAIVFGVITYDFTLPAAPGPTPSATNPTTGNEQPTSNERKAATTPSDERPAVVETKPKVDNAGAVSFYEKGVAFLTSGRYEEAAEALNQALRADPNDAVTYMKLAMSYSGMHKNKEAIASYKIASQIKQSVLDAPAYYMWGGSFLALDKTSEAISAFKEALNIMRAEAIGREPKKVQRFPSQEQVHHGLGIAYMNSKRFRDAIGELKQTVTMNPVNAEAHYGLAIAYLANGDRGAAENQNKTLRLLDRGLAQKVTDALAAPSIRAGCLTIACRQ